MKTGLCSPWHTPPFFYRPPLTNTTTSNTSQTAFPDTYYHDARLFAVVRNPYDRMVSEFNFNHRGQLRNGALANITQTQLQQTLNRWIQSQLLKYQQGLVRTRRMEKPNTNKDDHRVDSNFAKAAISSHIQTETTTTMIPCNNRHWSAFWKSYFQLDGHLIPQTHYIFSPQMVYESNITERVYESNITALSVASSTNATTVPGTNESVSSTNTFIPISRIITSRVQTMSTKPSDRLVHHVLFLEHLDTDLLRLLQAYNLHMNLTNSHKQNQRNRSSSSTKATTKPRLSASLLTDRTRKLIQQVYQDDFQVFGYQM